jgi:hypothetical protein
MPSHADDVTLIGLLLDGFEKNESIRGWHWRELPAPEEATAIAKFQEFAAEARRWKGEPRATVSESARRAVVWDDFQIRQQGRGVLVAGKSGGIGALWHADGTWKDDPMADVYDWFSSEARS